LSGLWISSGSARTIRHPDYQGTLSGPGVSGSVSLKLRDQKLRPLVVEVRDFVLQCEDGTTSTRSVVFQADVDDDGSFLSQVFRHSETGELYAQVTGKLKADKAKGVFYMISNSFDPNIGPDCSTPFAQPWKAPAVR
jgi:hypothetical protein